MVRKFWQSEIFLIWVQYLAAGIAAIPGGIVYAVLLERSMSQRPAFEVALLLAVGLGLVAWFGVGRLIRNAQPLKLVPQTLSSNTSWSMAGTTPVLATGAVLAVCLIGPPTTLGGVVGQGGFSGSPSAGSALPIIMQIRNWE